MSSTAGAGDSLNPKTRMTHTEMKQFVRDHFEEFINRKNLHIADMNFAPEFVEHGTDLPPGSPPGACWYQAVCGGVVQEVSRPSR